MRERGYTLVELMVVMAVLAMIVALVTPQFSRSLPGLQLNTASRELAGELRHAREEALRSGRDTHVRFDLALGRYAFSGSSVEKILPPGIAMSLTTAERETEGEGEGRIAFLADGTSTGGEVRLSGTTRTKLVQVDWFNGKIAVVEGP